MKMRVIRQWVTRLLTSLLPMVHFASFHFPLSLLTSIACVDGGRVVAQTPDGIRVAIPNPLREAPAAETTPSKGSYASALKAKPIDWHLEFSIEGHSIPLDTTIYGAIHQHEARKSSNPAQYLTSIWTGVYTIKFKKVPGPAPPSDGKPGAFCPA